MAKIIVVDNQPETLMLLRPLSVQPVHAQPESCCGMSFVFILQQDREIGAAMAASGKESMEIIRSIQATYPELRFMAFGEGRYISSEMPVRAVEELTHVYECLIE